MNEFQINPYVWITTDGSKFLMVVKIRDFVVTKSITQKQFDAILSRRYN